MQKLKHFRRKFLFKSLISRKHCLVPSTHFFESRHKASSKVHYAISMQDNSIFSLAGLFDSWVDNLSGNVFDTFTIVTTEANKLMSFIHNSKKRMPVILDKDSEEAWLSSQISIKDLSLFVNPFPGSMMKTHTVSDLLYSKKKVLNPSDVLKPFDYGDTDIFINYP